MRQLMDYYPAFYRDSPEFLALQQAIEPEIEALLEYRDSAMAQLNVDTASWGLQYWEKTLGISVDTTKQLSDRRNTVKERLLRRDTVTRTALCSLCSNYTKDTVHITEKAKLFMVMIWLEGAYPKSLSALTKLLLEIMPAHLSFGYVRVPEARRMQIYTGCALQKGCRAAVTCATPPTRNVVYFLDETGLILHDEEQINLIDKEE
jgi:hypothetical protein